MIKKILLAAGFLLALVLAELAIHYDPLWKWLTASEGRIIVNSPSVYTRQRLVNDRLQQSAWLQKQLDVTAETPKEFRVIDEVRRIAVENTLKASGNLALNPTQNSTVGPAEQSASQSQSAVDTHDSKAATPRADTPADGSYEVRPTSSDLFRAMNAYREEVRSEMMQTLLDDRHDISGNTIYRLAMDVTVLPGRYTTDHAIVSIVLRPHSGDDYKDIYDDWVRDLQTVVDGSMRSLAVQFAEGEIEARVKVMLPYFVADGLCRMIAAVMANTPPDTPACDMWSGKGTKAGDFAWRVLDSFVSHYLEHRRRVIEGRFKLEADPLPQNVTLIPGFPYFDYASRACERTANLWTDRPQTTPVPLKGGGKIPVKCPIFTFGTEGVLAGLTLHEYLATHADALANEIRRPENNRDPDSIAGNLLAASVGSACQAPDEGTCLAPALPLARLRCAAADYLIWSLNRLGDPHDTPKVLRWFLDLKTVGRQLQNCGVLIRPLSSGEDEGPKRLKDALETAVPEIYAYNVSPKILFQRISTTLDTRDVVQLMLGAKATIGSQEGSSLAEQIRKRTEQIQAIQQHPIVVGFGQVRGVESGKAKASFGWAMASRRADGDKLEQINGEFLVAAVISVPSWWRAADLDIRTCWVSPRELRPSVGDPAEICAGKKPDNKPETITVRLPGVVSDVSPKLGFEVVKEPHLDYDQIAQTLEAGYSGDILLTGGRLWRSTEVTLGPQKATSITVLPDMRGIVAHFACVATPPGNSVPVIAWTSEGRAAAPPKLITVQFGTARDAVPGRKPCDNNAPPAAAAAPPRPSPPAPPAPRSDQPAPAPLAVSPEPAARQ